MSRGGRAPTASTKVPFELDAEIVNGAERGAVDGDQENWLWPEIDLPTARPLSAKELREVEVYRQIQKARETGPWWTGSKEQWAAIDAEDAARKKSKNENGGIDWFNNAPTYSNKAKSNIWRLTPMDELPGVRNYLHLFPKEVRPYLLHGPGELRKIELAKKKNGFHASKSMRDTLAKFGENDEIEGNFEGDGNAEGEDEMELDEEGERDEDDDDDDEDEDRELKDDEYEENEDDRNDDYNAVQYEDFEDGMQGEDEDFGGGGEDGY